MSGTTTVWEVHSAAISGVDCLVYRDRNEAVMKLEELLDDDPGDVRICKQQYTQDQLDGIYEIFEKWWAGMTDQTAEQRVCPDHKEWPWCECNIAREDAANRLPVPSAPALEQKKLPQRPKLVFDYARQTSDYEFGEDEAYMDALESRIAELESSLARQREESKWISVEERLPEDGVLVLAYAFNSEDMGIPWVQTDERYKGDWLVMDSVTHWRPLPAPPAAESAKTEQP